MQTTGPTTGPTTGRTKATPESKAVPRADPARGVVSQQAAETKFAHARYVLDAVDTWVEHAWAVSWNLETPHAQTVVPHPAVHIVVEPEQAEVVGVPEGADVRTLRGSSWAFGIKLRPGTARALLASTGGPDAQAVSSSASALTGRTLPLERVFTGGASYAAAIRAAATDEARCALATAFVRAHAAPLSAAQALAVQACRHAEREPTTLDVARLAAALGVHVRRLQRVFRDEVGVSPGWVVRRYRVHEAMAKLEAGTHSLAALATELGYADQAHFSRDVRRMTGQSPMRYVP